MLNKLQNYKNVIKDLKEFEETISSIEDTKVKQNALSLLSQLNNQLHIINETHNPVTNHSIDPRKVRENVEILSSLRSKLKKIVNDSK